MQIRTLLLAALLLTMPLGTVGCSGIDGVVPSSVTGTESTGPEIEAAARIQEAAILQEASDLQAELDLLGVNYEADMALVGDEEARRDRLFTNGLGITTTLLGTFAPGATPFIEGVLPLVSDLFLLGGAGYLARRNGQKSGAATVAANVQAAAEADSSFADAINNGAAGRTLSKLNQKAPGPVQKAIAANKVVA